MADIYCTLRKIKALADGTNFEGERESALDKLRELMERHGISEQDLNHDTISTYDFKYKGERENLLLQQIFYKVMNVREFKTYEYRQRGKKVRNTVGLDCTLVQSVEIKFLFEFYRDLYRKEEQAFYIAFIHKHDIFGGVSDNTESEQVSEEELQKMFQMMRGMDNATLHKQLTDKSAE